MNRERRSRCGAGLLAGCLMALALPTTAAAQTSGPNAEQLLKLIQEQQRQLDGLKAQLQNARATADRAAAKAEEASASKRMPSLPDYITIGGTTEIEATESEAFDRSNTSDITLSKVELFVDAAPSEWLSTHVQLLYEDDGTETITLDEAWAKLGNPEKFPVYLQAGKWAVPFGNFDTDMSADPLTKDLGETREAAVLVGAQRYNVSLQAFAYNGDTQRSAHSNQIDQYGFAAGYEAEIATGRLSVGAAWISNMADSNNLTDTLGSAASALASYVPGYELHGAYAVGGFTLRGGYMSATRSFQTGEIAFAGHGAEPSAWNAELSYIARWIPQHDLTFAITAQGTGEALALGLPERRLGAALTVAVTDYAAVTLEYLHDEDYGVGDGGTGNDGHTATAKLAVEF